MEFRRVSDRLNFFFKPFSWALLTDIPNDGSVSRHVQVLKTACTHWGSKLEFPFMFEAEAFENTLEAREFWMEKLPGLRLLHYRKQEIIISDLFEGYDARRANELLRRKLKLDLNSWGHLLYFGGPSQNFVYTFPNMPEPNQLRNALEYFHQHHVLERQAEFEYEIQSNSNPFGMQNGLLDLSSSSAHLLLNANKAQSINNINRALRKEYDRIRISYHRATIEFMEMQKTVRLSPQCFALYCLYIDIEEGFTNKNRFQYRTRAIENYLRLVGRIENPLGIGPIESCFQPRDDKPLRDAINKIKKEFIKVIGNENWVKPYFVSGQNGRVKRIPIDRSLVFYEGNDGS